MNPEQKPEVPIVSTLTPPPATPVTPPPEVTPAEAPVKDKRRHFLAVFFFSFLFGVFGVDRFYLGKYWTGLLKLLTFGGFGIWAMIDLSLVMSGAMRDRQGNEMIDAARYKKFAKRTLWGFTLIVFLVVVVVGGISIYLVIQLMNNGGITQLLKGIPGFENLQVSGQKTPSIQDIQDLLKQINH